MRKTLLLRQQLNDAINQEIAARTKIHQARIAALKAAIKSRIALQAAPASAPLVMLAHGDSWFDYPLSGNSYTLKDTDVIAQLRTIGDINPVILNVSHYGDASTDELSWPKQQRMIDALGDEDNWINGKPDAILFSGGGNDIAGDQFAIFLDYAAPGVPGLNNLRFTKSLGIVEASYRDLFAFRDRYAPGVPIFGHCYDFPIPNGLHPDCVGPWLKPSLVYCGYNNLSDGIAILQNVLKQFKVLLDSLAGAANAFTVVQTQGTFTAADWANELHPEPEGFKKVAGEFVAALRKQFPGRI